MIRYEKVSKAYGRDVKVLDDVNFQIFPAEFVSIVGHSGAGKTTLIKLLLAEEKPTEGAVFYDSLAIHKLPHSKITEFRRKVGVVFQEYRLLPNKTAYENIAFAMEASGKTDEEIRSDVPHVLELVDLGHKLHSFPGQLSGGERQRIAIARAIINRPDIIVADEPTGSLDPVNTHEIVQILKKINDLGTTVILATHNKGVIDSLGRRVITMERGKIVRDDKVGKYSLK